ncbi:F-box/kelch-repeat protein [Zostera marina]|uniref:F-box/kelch-repeat protein n=1 Tax=Zostera marina TaxID=29655 RepID=A0A0K9PZX3_ZOSMR|nr:F-box/kelch-repeat protein [Zostera marina]
MEMEEAALIPGLPHEIAEHCLLHVPFPHQSTVRSVSSAWNRAISHPTFLHTRKALHLSLPYVFVFAFHRSTLRLQCLALDPRSGRWSILPPMPMPVPSSHSDPALSPSSFACAANAVRGELFFLGGTRSDRNSPMHTLISYKTSTNSWTVEEESSMPTARSYFSAGSIGGKIIVAGGGGVEEDSNSVYNGNADSSSVVECYDPVTSQWSQVAELRSRISKYDSAVVGKKMYITEGWRWPFDTAPRGSVYDAEMDCWGEMKLGLREGWTGSSVVLGEKLFVISECGECRVKVYSEEKDTWRGVIGSGVPVDLRKPFAMAGVVDEEGRRIYVVGAGLNVAVGSMEEVKGEWTVEWEVVQGPESFSKLSPAVSKVLYA